MFEEGLVEEVRGLLQQGLSGDEKPFESLGYKQALAHLRGQMSLEQAIRNPPKSRPANTPRDSLPGFAAFGRHDASTVWLAGFGSDPAVAEACLGGGP